MIDQIRIQNFKCIQDATLDLCPLTVLIGPNDSGKTSLLESIRLLEKFVTQEELPREQIERQVYRLQSKRVLRWRIVGSARSQPLTVNLSMPASGGQGFIEWNIADHENDSSLGIDRQLELAACRELTARYWESSGIYKFEPPKLRWPHAPDDTELSKTGDNLAAVLDAMMTGDDREGFLALEATLRRECPTLRGISLRVGRAFRSLGDDEMPERIAQKSIEFLLAGEGKVRVPASDVSDGVMLLTAYLALAYSNTPDLILLEEPENGLHPSRLQMIMTLLRKITTGEIGNRPRQILLTTHSPLLLNFCRKEEVRIVRRNAEGDTTIAKMEQAPNIDKLLHEFAIGELWYLLGEEGILKGERP